MSNAIPSPGSATAIEQGCTCPILDNNHGSGMDGLFWMNNNCPLHGTEPTLKRKIAREKEKVAPTPPKKASK